MDSNEGGDKPKGRPAGKSIDWIAIRMAYEGGETNMTALHKRFGVKRQSIARHRDDEKWITPSLLSNAAHSNVVDMVTRRAIEKVGGEAGIERAAETFANLLQDNPMLINLGYTAVENVLRKAANGQLKLGKMQGEADAVNAAVQALMKLTTMTREGAGLKSGQSSDIVDPAKRQPRRFVLVTPEEVKAREAG